MRLRASLLSSTPEFELVIHGRANSNATTLLQELLIRGSRVVKASGGSAKSMCRPNRLKYLHCAPHGPPQVGPTQALHYSLSHRPNCGTKYPGTCDESCLPDSATARAKRRPHSRCQRPPFIRIFIGSPCVVLSTLPLLRPPKHHFHHTFQPSTRD